MVQKKGAKETEGCPGLAHRTVRCATGQCLVHHRTLSGARGRSTPNSSPSGFWKCHSAIIHRTVRCGNGLSGVPCGVTATAPTVVYKSEQWSYSVRTARVESEQAPEGAPDSEQWLSGGPTCESSNGRTLTIGWRGWRTGQCSVAHQIVRCARRQTASPTATLLVGAINTPTTTLQGIQVFSQHIQYKS
jgi:hypothetical protein